MKKLLVLLSLLLLFSCQKDQEVLPSRDGLTFSARAAFPSILPLPQGFQPEGIVIGSGSDFFVGSIVSGRIYKGDLRSGEGAEFIIPPPQSQAIGLSFDNRSKYLFVAGGFTGTASVYDSRTGTLLRTYTLTDPGTNLINDVIVTRDGAYFTNSVMPELYKVPLQSNGLLAMQGQVQTIPLSGDFSMVPVGLPGFPFPIFSNGIDADPSCKKLILGNLDRGEFYVVNPRTGHADLIDLGGASVPYADGIVLDGKTLYVAQNFLNQIAVIHLDSDLMSGNVATPITNLAFGIPSTIGKFGRSLYVVNAHFDIAPPTGLHPLVDFEVVKVPIK